MVRLKQLSLSRTLCNVCVREERRERQRGLERERVNNIKKCKKKEESSRTKKAKIYLRTKDTHLGDAQSTIQFGNTIWQTCTQMVKVFGKNLRKQENGGLKQQHKEMKMPRKHSRGDTWTINI